MDNLGRILKASVFSLAAGACFFTQVEADQCGYDNYCGCTNRSWVDAEYLYWEINNAPESVPLVFSSDSEGALLSDPGSTVVLGGKSVDIDWRSGGRFSVGSWFDDERCFGLEANYFFLPTASAKHSVFSDGLPGSAFLSIPYFDATDDGAEAAYPIADSEGDRYDGGPFAGLASLKINNWMQNAELNALTSYEWGCGDYKLNVTWLAGFRYWNFNEDLHFKVSSPFIETADDVFVISDKFDTQNNFYGGQLGLALDYNYDCFFANIKGKVALGANCGEVKIRGSFLTNEFTSSVAGPLTESFEGGFFALPTNIGTHSRSVFSVIPEVNINLGYSITECARIQVGYTFLYASNVYIPGKQIDPLLNLEQAPAFNFPTEEAIPADPVAWHKSSSLWAQGISAGFEFRF